MMTMNLYEGDHSCDKEMAEILGKSRIWRDIDKHPLPRESCKIDVKLKCGSVLIDCNLCASDYCLQVAFDDYWLTFSDITQWRDANKGEI